ncbi:GlsB/YeaQ/YmgE family stress response membrane protein [Neomegalonema sp.]|uniref:GlsB/YeaQ/YmgE family stress response membrane protein n=1 Tax=Neomegalonema sp. TaxID=2039713 RepID=UPI002629C82D|nr:GlsB/YeaQ/YmgE family stress response membrane protein [Neomegalonema sp.]MDD2868895.1 GlsB/YeaQ/YmgE family stress response membrane protein [Neomegalonema sp.]
MSFIVILGIILGAAIGWFAARNRVLDADPLAAAALGGLGGFVGGLALKVILPVAFALLGALVGAALLLVLYKLVVDSRR